MIKKHKYIVIIPPGFEEIKPFSEGLAPIRLNDKWGFIDYESRVIITPEFDQVEGFKDGFAVVTKNDKFGFIDKSGKITIPCIFSYAFGFSEELAAVQLDDRWGFVNSKGEMVIKAQYDLVTSFNQGTANVCIDKQWGCIDTEGKFTVPFQAPVFCKKYGYIGFVMVEDKWKCIEFSDGTIEQLIKSDNSTWLNVDFETNGKWAAFDPYGNMLLPPILDDYPYISEDIARIIVDGKYGFADLNGNIIIQPKFESAGMFSEGLAAAKLGEKYGFIAKDGNWIIQPQYDRAGNFKEGRAVVKKDKQYMLIDHSNKVLGTYNFDYLANFNSGMAAFRIGTLPECGYIDLAGKIVIPAVFNRSYGFEGEYAVAEVEEKCGVINKQGGWVIQPFADRIEILSDEIIAFSNNNRYGLMDISGKTLLPAIYDSISWLDSGDLLVATLDDYQAVFNKKGQLLIGENLKFVEKISKDLAKARMDDYDIIFDIEGNIVFQADSIGMFQDGFALLYSNTNYIYIDANENPAKLRIHKYEKEGKYGLKNNYGEIIAEAIFDNILEWKEGLAVFSIRTENKYGYIDKTGKVVLQGYLAASDFKNGLARVLTDFGWAYIDKNGDYKLCQLGIWRLNDAQEIKFSEEYLAVVDELKRQYEALNHLKWYERDSILREKEMLGRTLKDFVQDCLYYHLNHPFSNVERFRWQISLQGCEYLVRPKFFFFERKAEHFEEGLIVASTSKRQGYINLQGEFVIPPIFKYVSPFKDGTAIVKSENGLKGAMDKTGKFIVPPEYSILSDFQDGLALFKVDWDYGKFGYIDKKGVHVVPELFYEASDFSEGLAAVKITNKWGYIDTTGKVVIPPIYESASNFKDGIAEVKAGSRHGSVSVLDRLEDL